LKIASVAMFTPVPKWGAMMAFLDASDEGREFTRTIMSSSAEITDEWFENEAVKIAITRFASEMMISPYEVGPGNAMFFASSLHMGGYGLVEGGSGGLSMALAACIRDNKGVIKTSSPVKSIRTGGGEAKSVLLENGEEIVAAKAIVSNLNVRQLFLDIVEQGALSPEFTDKIRRIRPSAFSAMNIAIATKVAPVFRNGNKCDAMFTEINPWIDDYRRMFEDFSRGIPGTGMPLIAVPTVYDPTRAPCGQHTVYLYHYEPYKLRDGGASEWDSIKDEIAKKIIEVLSVHISGLDNENVLGMKVFSPLDIERYNPAMQSGDIMHISSSIAQSYGNRPVGGWGQYRTPVKRLYMCGASTHPGGGVTGGGRAAALLIMEDLGIDYKKVVGK
jgi:phytoene dehydrogenase-like protein